MANSIGDFLKDLKDSFDFPGSANQNDSLRKKLEDLKTALVNSTSEEEQRLRENLNPAGAAGVAQVLTTLIEQTSNDLIDLQTAERVSRAYLLATDWVETLDIKNQKARITAIRDARAEIRSQLDNIGKQDKTLLKQLVQESETLAAPTASNAPTITLGAIISHLTLAVDTLRQTRDNPDLIAPKISRALTENWAKILEKVEKIGTPTNEVDLQRVADLLTIRQLLDEAYDLLAEDISADSPLDVVNI
jgi:hypothetical protein